MQLFHFLGGESGKLRNNAWMCCLPKLLRRATVLCCSVLWHHEHLVVLLPAPEHVPSQSLTVWQIKPPYLHTCSFSQAASPSVCVNPRTWSSPGPEFMQHHEKTSTRCTYQWRSEAAKTVRSINGLGTFPKLWLLIVSHVFTDCLSRFRCFWVPSTHPKKPNQNN